MGRWRRQGGGEGGSRVLAVGLHCHGWQRSERAHRVPNWLEKKTVGRGRSALGAACEGGGALVGAKGACRFQGRGKKNEREKPKRKRRAVQAERRMTEKADAGGACGVVWE